MNVTANRKIREEERKKKERKNFMEGDVSILDNGN